MMSIVIAGLAVYRNIRNAEITALENRLYDINLCLPNIQNADLVFISDLSGKVLDLPEDQSSIISLLAKLGLLNYLDNDDQYEEPDSGGQSKLPVDIEETKRTLEKIIKLISKDIPRTEKLRLIMEDPKCAALLKALASFEDHGNLTPEDFAIALILHFSGATAPKDCKDLFDLDTNSRGYKDARSRLVKACAERLAEIFCGGHGYSVQDVLILLGPDRSRFSQSVINAMLYESCGIITCGRETHRMSVSETPLHPVFHKLGDLLQISNQYDPIFLYDFPAEDSPFAKSMGDEWSVCKIRNRANKIVGFEAKTRRLSAAVIEVNESLLSYAELNDIAFQAIIGNRLNSTSDSVGLSDSAVVGAMTKNGDHELCNKESGSALGPLADMLPKRDEELREWNSVCNFKSGEIRSVEEIAYTLDYLYHEGHTSTKDFPSRHDKYKEDKLIVRDKNGPIVRRNIENQTEKEAKVGRNNLRSIIGRSLRKANRNERLERFLKKAAQYYKDNIVQN